MKYLTLLKGVTSVSIDLVGSVEWGFVNGQPISPAIIKAWREADLIEDYKFGEAIVTEKAKRLLEKGK